jgi:prolyl oligopeptidase
VIVLANIRGGGEYGPEWHVAAWRDKRQTAYDDFQAVAKDLIKRKVTFPKGIGIFGGSNGGILVTMSFIQQPGLFGAVISRMGALELRSCSGLTGVRPTGERGDGDIPEHWAYMRHYSPFHNLEPGKNYPPVFLFSNRSDDIVHPCHSRKFALRMHELGYGEVYYLENETGGHGSMDLSNQHELQLAFFYRNLHPDYTGIVAREKEKD